jgi:hypothetical protein
MSSVARELHSLNSTRLRHVVFPREHGAWGILLVPLATGGWVAAREGGSPALLAWFALAALALFLLRTPVEVWLETAPLRAGTPAERKALFVSAAIYGAVAATALAFLLAGGRAAGLLLLGAAVAAAFGVQAALRKLGRENRMAAQMIGALGLTATAAGAYFVVTGRLDSTAMSLWAANWLFAANQIHYVQTRIHNARLTDPREKLARGRAFLAGQFATALLLGLGWRAALLPGAAALAFGPVLVRGFAWFGRGRRPLAIYRLGFTELAHALVFGVLLILGYRIDG